MTAKEIQAKFIKTYLKPTLKLHDYKTSGQTWWKNMGDFFFVINLQNSQWNSKEEISFCLNIGIALTEKLTDKEKKKATRSQVRHNRQNAKFTLVYERKTVGIRYSHVIRKFWTVRQDQSISIVCNKTDNELRQRPTHNGIHASGDISPQKHLCEFTSASPA